MKKFPYLEHAENVALALEVCKDAGVKEEVALKGMLKASPDPGALVIWELNMKNKHQFVSAFAANDPKSTLKIWELLEKVGILFKIYHFSKISQIWLEHQEKLYLELLKFLKIKV